MTDFIITIIFNKYNEIKHSIFLILDGILKSMACTHISSDVLLTFFVSLNLHLPLCSCYDYNFSITISNVPF